MTNIYVITEGYNDNLVGVFETKNNAKNFIKMFGKDNEFDIEKRVLNPYQEYYNLKLKFYFVRINVAIEKIEIFQEDCGSSIINSKESTGYDVHNNLYVQVFAKNEKEAEHSAKRIARKIKRENKWGISPD